MSERVLGSRSFLTFFISVILLLGCGQQPSGGGAAPVTPPPANPGAVVTLALFGAPWCDNCKNEFPKVQQLISQLSRAQADKLNYILYVTTGSSAQDQPTQEIAEKYLEVLHLTARAYPDEWRWKNFRKLVGGSLVLPGAAILDAQGNVIQSFRAGATTFVPSEIVKAVEEALK